MGRCLNVNACSSSASPPGLLPLQAPPQTPPPSSPQLLGSHAPQPAACPLLYPDSSVFPRLLFSSGFSLCLYHLLHRLLQCPFSSPNAPSSFLLRFFRLLGSSLILSSPVLLPPAPSLLLLSSHPASFSSSPSPFPSPQHTLSQDPLLSPGLILDFALLDVSFHRLLLSPLPLDSQHLFRSSFSSSSSPFPSPSVLGNSASPSGSSPASQSDRWVRRQPVLGARLTTPATLPWRRSRGLLDPPRTWSTCVTRPTRVHER